MGALLNRCMPGHKRMAFGSSTNHHQFTPNASSFNITGKPIITMLIYPYDFPGVFGGRSNLRDSQGGVWEGPLGPPLTGEAVQGGFGGRSLPGKAGEVCGGGSGKAGAEPAGKGRERQAQGSGWLLGPPRRGEAHLPRIT